MSRKNRETLKNYFAGGARPSAEHFATLIDSVLNIVDEGFDKSVEYGFEVSAEGDQESLITFFRKNHPKDPLWSIRLGQSRDTLQIEKITPGQKASSVLSITEDRKIGINHETPEHPLDVQGMIKSEGRIGSVLPIENEVLADGEWHDITEDLRGCQAFEVMAGAGKKETGQYALMHAIAMNTFNPTGFFFNFLNRKKKIKYHHAYFRSMGQKLKLRWIEIKGPPEHIYRLQIRSNSSYGQGIRIVYHLTNLWDDVDMSTSWQSSKNVS